METGILVFAVAIAGCSKVSTPDSNPPFTVDARQPFHLEFGRGSGLDGLEMFILDESGSAILTRQPRGAEEVWHQTQLQLSPKLVEELISDINNERLTYLARSYVDRRIVDGSQWEFLLVQGAHRKTISFSNDFPDAINRFAKEVDGVLDRAGVEKAEWKPLDRRLDKNLWDAVELAK